MSRGPSGASAAEAMVTLIFFVDTKYDSHPSTFNEAVLIVTRLVERLRLPCLGRNARARSRGTALVLA
jgi:hypothetical protein